MTDTITPWHERKLNYALEYPREAAMQAEIAQLRAALAQQAEPVPATGDCFKSYGAMCARCGHDEFVLPAAPKGGV